LPPAVARLPYHFSSTEFGPLTTVAAPPVPEQVSTYKPATIRDVLTAEALDEIYQWFRCELNDLHGYSLDPPRKHCSNKPLVIDQSSFVVEACGLFWDLTTNPPSLMQRHLPGTPRLNAAAILAAAGADYPDKELPDAIAHGVRMQTDHQMLLVLNPGLLSLSGYLRQYGADITRMEADGMLLVCRFLPYVQGVLLPQGPVCKAHAEDDRRRITDAGAPRSPLIARDGTRVMSVNDGGRMPLADGQPLTPQEDKPCVGVNVNDNSILAYLGEAMRKDNFAPHEYQTFLACDDIKAFFNQFTLHPSERSRFCLTLLRDGDLYVAAELVLCFGCASSGIAQRFAHLVRQIVSERMAAEDAPFVADLRRRAGPHVRAWFAIRDALTAETGIEQALLFCINVYTDDSCKGAVGAHAALPPQLGQDVPGARHPVRGRAQAGPWHLHRLAGRHPLPHALRRVHPDRQGHQRFGRPHGHPRGRAHAVRLRL
jgi:hypothetical protein